MPSSTTSSEPTRVLLVDDNEAMLARAAAVLDTRLRRRRLGEGRAGGARGGAALAAGRHRARHLDAGHDRARGRGAPAQAGSTAAVVFLTVHDEEEFVLAARAAGGIGYVVKPRLASDLLTAVREAQVGCRFVSPLR